jgi:transposase
VTRHSAAAVNDLLSGLGVNRIRQLDERTTAMTTLADDYDYVIGGDPDRDTIDLAVLDTATGSIRAHLEESADGAGYARMLSWARNHAPGRRVWALEGTGSFAAGLAGELALAGEDVVEVGALKRARGAKNDRLDAVRAARTAMAREHQSSPRVRGLREAIRALAATRQAVLVSRTKAINELKSLIVVSPEALRALLRGRPLAAQLTLIESMSTPAAATVEHRVTVLTLQSITARIRFLTGQLADIDPELGRLIQEHPAGPVLLAEPGVGPVVAAQLLISWSHPGRVRSEAAFASLAGVAPLEASSGQRTRHRLNRGGDRALNRALHTVAITRIRCHAETRAYEARRTLQGKTHRDIRRCLKRTLARHLYRVMEAAAASHPVPSAG